MIIAVESSMLSGPWLAVDPAAIAVLTALETSVVAAAIVASAVITVTSAYNNNQLLAGDVASLLMVAAASLLLCAPLSVAATAANSDINRELVGGNVVKGAGTMTCSIITRAGKTSLRDYFEGSVYSWCQICIVIGGYCHAQCETSYNDAIGER